MRHLTLLLLLLAPTLASCVGVSSKVYTSSYDGAVIAKRSFDGYELTWSIGPSSGDGPVLERDEKRTAPIAFLGVAARDVDQMIASSSGLPAYEGIWISTVESGTAAARGGLQIGDVLLSLGDVQFTSVAQFQHAMRSQIEPEVAVTARVKRFRSEKDYEDLEFTITPSAKRTSEMISESVPLAGSSVVRDLTGMQVGEVPADVATEWSNEDANQVWVAAVAPGSPAYLSGLRAGDRIVTLQGESVETLDQVRRAVVGRARSKGLSVQDASESLIGDIDPVDGPLAIEVRGRMGSHAAKLDVSARGEGQSSVDIPILFECTESRSSTRWSLLDFIFQFGANYNGQYLSSANREPARRTFFSMLPFGFFEVEKRPGYGRYCVLWFIEWETNG